MALEKLAVSQCRATPPVISEASCFWTEKVYGSNVKESPEYPTILQRIAQSDRIAVRECIDAYGSRIWAFAKKNAATTEEAETITEEIFLEIWKHAARFDPERCCEIKFVALLAFRHLIRQAREINH